MRVSLEPYARFVKRVRETMFKGLWRIKMDVGPLTSLSVSKYPLDLGSLTQL